MDIFAHTLSPWGKTCSFDDPLVNLSNKKNRHATFNDSKDFNFDRYIAQSVQKCLFKDKLEFGMENSARVE
jgi:hypothetical protein